MLIVNLLRIGKSEKYFLDFPLDWEIVNNIKSLPFEDRLFNEQENKWVVTAVGIKQLIFKYKGRTSIKFQFENDKQRQQFININAKHDKLNQKKAIAAQELKEHNDKILDIRVNLKELAHNTDFSKYLKEGITLMEHQGEACYFVNSLDSCILALEMGLGKTIVSIIACLMDENVKQVLVICPANLKINWLKEVEMFTNSTAYIIKYQKDRLVKYRRNKDRTLEECKFIITNYEYFARSDFSIDKKIVNINLKPDVIIFDEAHRMSNKDAQSTSRIIQCFDKRVKRKIMLSGTPIRNRLKDLFLMLKMVKPQEFSNQNKFLKEYCGLKYDKKAYGWVKDHSREPKLKELNEKLSTVMFRMKKNVMTDLPALYINKVYLEMTPEETKTYNEIEEGLKKVDWNDLNIVQTTDDDHNSVIVIINRLRQFTSKLKCKYVKQLIEEFNEQGEKVIVFDVFKKPLHELKELLGNNSEVYDGELTTEKKQSFVEEFQDKDSRLMNLLISMIAGNSGITLTKSNRVFLISQDYLNSNNDQSFSRAHRKSQLRDVFGSIFIVADTIDEMIDNALIEKKKVIDKVIDGEDYIDNSAISVFGDVLRQLKEKYTKSDEYVE